MNRKTTILILLLLLSGIAVLAYPTVSNFINQQHGSYAIQELREQLQQVDSVEIAQQRRLAEAYNAALPEEGENYDSILNFGNGIMGYIQIPKISVDLPIYHGSDEEVLTKGVGHMPESAFPIGGEGNHSVLTGHTGLPSAELFTDLTELEEGDLFYITILGETLVYQVDQIKVVLPSEGEDLAVVPGKDYCTLVTCTPYGVNSHRLLVRGARVETAPEELESQLPQEGNRQMGLPVWLFAVLAAVIVILLFLLLWIRKR